MATRHADFMLGDWHVSPGINRLSRKGQAVSVKPKSMAVLVRLATDGGEFLTRDEIMDSVWPGMDVTDDVLTQSIVELRKALEDDARQPRYIETIPRVGFRLIAAVTPLGQEKAMRMQSTRKMLPNSRLRAVFVVVSLLMLVWMITEWRSSERHPIIEVPDTPSIAVLPFVNLSGDSGNEYLSDGMAEEIRNLLALIPNLTVIGRTSSHAYKGHDQDLRAIGQDLGVSTILEGSVRISGERVRIAAQLTDTSDGALIWSASYEPTFTNIFAMQDEVAAEVIDALQLYVVTNPSRGRPTDSPEAYALFLKARASLYGGEPRKAEGLLFDALELDPEFAEASEFLAFLYWATGGIGQDAVATQELVHEFAGRAVTANPNLLFADVFHKISAIGFDYQIGIVELSERALAQQPNNPWLLDAMTWTLQETGYIAASLPLAARYLEVDPLSTFADAYYIAALYAGGRKEDALARIEARDRSNGEMDVFQMTLLGIMVAEGREDYAAEVFTSWLPKTADAGPAWFATLAADARNPVAGQASVDDRIRQLLASLPEDEAFAWQQTLPALHLFFGHLDRYFKLIKDSGPTDKTWHHAANFVWQGTVLRHGGFTAHPDYLEVVNRLGINRVWDKRGPPDFCEKLADQWNCE